MIYRVYISWMKLIENSLSLNIISRIPHIKHKNHLQIRPKLLLYNKIEFENGIENEAYKG